MSGTRLAAPHGTRIDRKRALRFTFEGRGIDAFEGDTVASALLAAGTRIITRSFKLQRPRGVFACGIEEPCAIADLGSGAARIANARLTDVLARDGLVVTGGGAPRAVAALTSRMSAYMPAGFYYKTFMWPNWKLFEPTVREMAAKSIAPDAVDPARYDEVSIVADVLVVGGGLAGMQSALSAARAGQQVLLLEGDVDLGGWMATQALHPTLGAAERVLASQRALAAAGVRVLTRTVATGVYDHGLVTAIESLEGAAGLVRERLWKIRAGRIIVATGAFERPMLFPDNDRPGVMLAGAAERYATQYGVACGRKVVIATACDGAYAVARALRAAGIDVVGIVDARPSADSDDPQHPHGVRVLADSVIVGVRGTAGVEAVQVASNRGGALTEIKADAIACAGGVTPNVSLYSQAGGTLRWVSGSSMFVPDRALPNLAVVGACAGAFELEQALAHAEEVGAAAPGSSTPVARVGGVGRVLADTRPTAAALGALGGRPGKIFVDLHNDVTAADVELAVRENYRSVEHLKRYTTTGMASDQGKTSNVNALVLLGEATGRTPERVGTTRFRPPYTPATLNAIAGGRVGSRLRPLKHLSARAFHEARGALFEEFGGWARPAAYPHPGENLDTAAQREAAQVRAGVGLFDGSPLGKIEVYGPDAAAFLDLMYLGTMSSLPVGGARYGVLLNENGVVIDDGVVARLGASHFFVNTTSGGVDRAVLAFEEWLQCEYVDLRVFVVPMTSQWGNVTASGPKAWELLRKAGFDESLAPASMKHMTMRSCNYGGDPVRVLRASFNGELGYEVNLPMARTQALFERLWADGQEFEVCPYGVEALMVMRTEKGFIHVGVDTDGTTLPQDIGLGRAVAKKAANFVGRRSMSRAAGQDPDRLQLVGLQPVDRRTRLAAGAHLSLHPPPTQAEGFVTSSYYSPTLGQPVALGMLRRGTQRMGERLGAWHLGQSVEVEVVKTPFFDPAGERAHG
jgi:sarcosine oxidase, subunit alpha